MLAAAVAGFAYFRSRSPKPARHYGSTGAGGMFVNPIAGNNTASKPNTAYSNPAYAYEHTAVGMEDNFVYSGGAATNC